MTQASPPSDSPNTATSGAATAAAKTWPGAFDFAYLQAFEAKMFIEGPQTERRLMNFFVLLLLATVIATFGLLSASTATVIGAMIVAPLMGPIMATAAAVVMGSLSRALRALVLVAVGVAAVIGLSALLGLAAPEVTISFTENSELASRISPGLYALITALAAGAAGAFIVERAEIADSMGGVAIAISLVPPLCVVGIALSVGEWSHAAGAMLLFLTNFLAILFAGGLVFLISGLGRVAITKDEVQVRRRAFVLIIASGVLITVPLTATSYNVLRDTNDTQKATEVVREWLGSTPNRIVSVEVHGDAVNVTVAGQTDTLQSQPLANRLAASLRRPISVYLRAIPARFDTVPGASP
ncbi:MAG: DUF389 domain-containing protein [Anaerolineae bacterium]